MSSFISLFVTYKHPETGEETPLSTESVVAMFDSYIPGDPDDDSDARFCALPEVAYGELPDFLKEEYGEDSGRNFAEMSLDEFVAGHDKVIEKYNRRSANCLEALGLEVDDEDSYGGLKVYSGKLDSEGRKNTDYSPLTWPVDKKLVLKTTELAGDMWMALKAMGVYRVIRDMVPYGVDEKDIRMILIRH